MSSTLQDDKESLGSKRNRKPDPGQEIKMEDYFKAHRRDATVESLTKRCDELDLGKKVQDMWLMHDSHISTANERLKKLQNWDEHIEDVEMNYKGTSNIHIPLPMIVLKTFHARMYQALLAVDPPFSVRAMQEAFKDDEEMVFGLMAWTLKEWCNYNEGIEQVADEWLWNWCGWGTGDLKVRWDCRYTRYVDVVDSYQQGPSTYEIVINPDTGAIENVEKPSVIRVPIETPITDKLWEGPVIEFVSRTDLAIIQGLSIGKNIQRADAIIHRSWFTADQLQHEALRGVFDQKAVDDMIYAGPHSEGGKLAMDIQQDREIHSGKQTLDINEDQDRYEILEAYLETDVNRDGLNEAIILWIDNQSGTILRATYTHRVLRGGKRPFSHTEFIPRKDHGYAMGLLELIHPISVELDMIHNIKVDIGIMAAQPIGFYRAATGLDPVKLKIKPGDLIPVDEPANHVNFPQLGDRSGFFKDEEAILLQHAERLTAINDINTATLGRQGAARTATGVSQLVAENSANLDIFIKRMQRGWKEMLRILWQMLQQRLPNGTEFRVTGRDGRDYFKRINRMDIQQRVDFFIESTSVNSNRQLMLEQSMQVLAQMMNPLFLQMGITTPGGVYEALKDYFQALGRKDYARFIMKPANVMRQLTSEEELARIIHGKRVPITPDMDHQGFIELAQDLLSNEDTIKSFGGERIGQVKAQMQQHMSMLEAMNAQAGQIAQASQQQYNAMGVAGGVQPGGSPMLSQGNIPFLNPYNDFQQSRGQLMNQLGEKTGTMIPGMMSQP